MFLSSPSTSPVQQAIKSLFAVSSLLYTFPLDIILSVLPQVFSLCVRRIFTAHYSKRALYGHDVTTEGEASVMFLSSHTGGTNSSHRFVVPFSLEEIPISSFLIVRSSVDGLQDSSDRHSKSKMASRSSSHMFREDLRFHSFTRYRTEFLACLFSVFSRLSDLIWTATV